MANRRYNTQVAQPRGADRVKRAGGGMGGRSGPMMYSRGQGVNMRSKRVPTELMDRGAMKKGGKVIKPKGPGVLRPKPTDRYGQQMKPKPIKPGKKDGGKIVGDYVEKKRSEFKSKRKDLKKVNPNQKGLKKLPTEVRNKMGYMKDGGKVKDKTKPKKPLSGSMKKPKPGSSDYQILQTGKPRPSQILPKKAKGGRVNKEVKARNKASKKMFKKFGGGKK